MPSVCVCARFVCHIPACLRRMQMADVGRGCWEGQLHGKLLVLIQHVEQGRRGVLFNKAPPPSPPLLFCQLTHTNKHIHTHTHSMFSSCVHSQTNITVKKKKHTQHKERRPQVLSHTRKQRTPVSGLRIQTDMNEYENKSHDLKTHCHSAGCNTKVL